MSQLSIDLHFTKSYHFLLTGIPPPSVKLLARELSDVDNWYQLGTVLGVPPEQLDEIRRSSPVGGTGEWRIAMFKAWLNSKPNASWLDVIEAVKSKPLRHIALAAILKSKYMQKTTEPSHDAGIYTHVYNQTSVLCSLYVYHVCILIILYCCSFIQFQQKCRR